MNFVVIVAGGKGSRFSSSIKKQFFKINGKISILEKTISIFNNHNLIHSIVVVLPKENLRFSKELYLKFKKITNIVKGGNERKYSVFNGLESIKKLLNEKSKILIHDGVRPFVTESLIEKVLKELDYFDSVIPCITIDDTLKKINSDGFVVETVDRDSYVRVQTPQGFNRDILEMYKKVIKLNLNFTDDSYIPEYFGRKVKIIQGEKKNIKITTTEDLYSF